MLNKGVSALIASTLIVVVSITAIAMVMAVGLPAIEKAKEAAVLDEAMRNMKIIGSMVGEISSEGVGSLTSQDIKVTKGVYKVNEQGNSIDFTMSSTGGYIQPGSFIREGDITLSSGSNSKSSVYDMDGDGLDEIVLENEIMKVGLLKNGTEGSASFMNTSGFVKIMFLKDSGYNVTIASSPIVIDDIADSSYGTGYSEILRAGDGLSKAEAVEHVNSTFVVYDVLYSLQSGADFLTVKILNAYYK